MAFMAATKSLLDTYNWHSKCRNLLQTLSQSRYPATGEELEDAFWRTLVFNKDHLGQEPGPEFSRLYDVWLSATKTGYELGKASQNLQDLQDQTTSSSSSPPQSMDLLRISEVMQLGSMRWISQKEVSDSAHFTTALEKTG